MDANATKREALICEKTHRWMVTDVTPDNFSALKSCWTGHLKIITHYQRCSIRFNYIYFKESWIILGSIIEKRVILALFLRVFLLIVARAIFLQSIAIGNGISHSFTNWSLEKNNLRCLRCCIRMQPSRWYVYRIIALGEKRY